MRSASREIWTVLLLAGLLGCSANGGDTNPGADGEDPPGEEEPPVDPDITDWTPISRGAAAGVFTPSCTPLSSCTVADEANAFDGDESTSALVTITGGVGDSVSATFDTGPISVSDTGVAAIELSSAMGTGYGATVETLFEGESVDADCGSLSELDTIPGTGGVILLGCKHSDTYDQIVLTLTVSALAPGQDITIVDVVTAAMPPQEDPPAQ